MTILPISSSIDVLLERQRKAMHHLWKARTSASARKRMIQDLDKATRQIEWEARHTFLPEEAS